MIMKITLKHSFIAADTVTNQLFEIDENGNTVWEFNAARTVFDLWGVENDKILYCYYGGGTDDSGVKSNRQKR